uniref:Tudor domain-containing protein n=1 Tax=Rhodnius prolixus TaxID=13249 RepID=T1HI53_RHOPR
MVIMETNVFFYFNSIFYDDVEENYRMHENIIKPGQVCCVRFHLDNRWYRSKILEIQDKNKIKVSYVDYGTINWESQDSLRLLHKKFIEDPVHVVRAKLHNLQPVNHKTEWDNEVNYFLFEILYQKTFYACILEANEIPVISVMLIDTSQDEDVNINDILIQKGFARCSAILSINKVKDDADFERHEVYQKDYCGDVSDLLAGILQKILPVWLTLGAPMDAEGIRGLFKEIEESAESGNKNKPLNTCCSSHFIRSMFLKDVTLLKNESPLETVIENGNMESNVTMQTSHLSLSESQLMGIGDCSENIQSVKSRRKGGFDFYPNFPSKKDSCASSVISSRNLSPRSGLICPLQCERDEKKFVFEAELDDGRTLIVVQLVNQTYVVQEQILRDFTNGIPFMLLKHRANKFTDQSENVTITSTSHPGIYRSLK